MALFLLDTTTLTLLQRGHPVVEANVTAHIGHELGITSINVEEALGGWYALLRQARTNAHQAYAAERLANAFMFLARFRVFPVNEPSLDRADQLGKLKLNVGRMDLKIAALALELGATSSPITSAISPASPVCLGWIGPSDDGSDLHHTLP